MALPLIVGLVLGTLVLITLALIANRSRPRQAHDAAAHRDTDGGYTPLMFGDSTSSTGADCGDAGSGDGGGCD